MQDLLLQNVSIKRDLNLQNETLVEPPSFDMQPYLEDGISWCGFLTGVQLCIFMFWFGNEVSIFNPNKERQKKKKKTLLGFREVQMYTAKSLFLTDQEEHL